MSRLLYQAELHRQANVWAGQSPLTESNRRPSPYHGDALPTELRGRRTGRRLQDRAGRSERDIRLLQQELPLPGVARQARRRAVLTGCFLASSELRQQVGAGRRQIDVRREPTVLGE